jgi:hypothetical protein
LYAVLILALPYLLLAADVRADNSAADNATAEVLFNQAKVAFEAGRFDEACPKYAEAQRLHPTPGTLLNVGRCEEARGNLATAYGANLAAAILAHKIEDKVGREESARAEVKRLEPLLSMLVLNIPPGARVEGLQITRNGSAVGEGQWGAPVPVDAGVITIEASAPGRTAWKSSVTIERKPGSTTVDVPALALAPVALQVDKGEPESAWSGQKTVALAVGGAGVIGGVLGTIFGVKAIGKKSDADAACQPNEPNQCNAAGVALRHEEKSAGTISTISFIAGGVALAGGVVLFVTAPTGSAKKREAMRFEVRPAVAGGDMGLTLRGSW